MATDPVQALGLAGTSVAVTGGTRGVGRGVARRFSDAGARVYVLARNASEDPIGTFVECDVRDPASVDRAFEAIERDGPVGVLINNAGGSPPVQAAEASPRFHAAIIDLNLTAALHCAQRARRSMAAAGGGVIVNIASVSGMRPSPATAAYGAAKAGLISLTGSLAAEWAPDVRVCCVAPGPVRTEHTPLHFPDADALARAEAAIPMGRFARPEDVGDACLFLASPLAAYVTGATLVVAGGDYATA